MDISLITLLKKKNVVIKLKTSDGLKTEIGKVSGADNVIVMLRKKDKTLVIPVHNILSIEYNS